MYKLSEMYKFVIFRLTGLKNDMEFRTLETMFNEYKVAKEDEEIMKMKTQNE